MTSPLLLAERGDLWLGSTRRVFGPRTVGAGPPGGGEDVAPPGPITRSSSWKAMSAQGRIGSSSAHFTSIPAPTPTSTRKCAAFDGGGGGGRRPSGPPAGGGGPSRLTATPPGGGGGAPPISGPDGPPGGGVGWARALVANNAARQMPETVIVVVLIGRPLVTGARRPSETRAQWMCQNLSH